MFKALKWLVRQPMNAAKFVSRQAGTKTGRLCMATIGTTIIAQVGGENVAPHAPMIADVALEVVANPTTATLVNLGAFALMYHRDKALKDAQNKAAARAKRKPRATAAPK